MEKDNNDKKELKNGKIKWYSSVKEYGFLTDEEGTDIYFKKESIYKSNDKIDIKKETEYLIPKNGDLIKFKLIKTKKGQLLGTKIIITQRRNPEFLCPNCDMISKRKIINEKEETKGQILYTVCENCYYKLEEFKTINSDITRHNRAASLILILIVIAIFFSFIK